MVNFPTSLDNDSSLFVAGNRVQTALNGAITNVASTITVVSTAGIVANMLLTIDSEIMKVIIPPVGSVVTVSRAFDGTVAVAHVNNSIVSAFIDAGHQRVLKEAIIAVETYLGPNGVNITSNLILSSKYNFTPIVVGGSLSIGSNTVTLPIVPLGINGSNTVHYLYISNGVGNPEACLITGGTGLSGGVNGQIIITCANTHSGAWTISSDSGGLSEAMFANPGKEVLIDNAIVTAAGVTVSYPKTIISGNDAISSITAHDNSMLNTVLTIAADGIRLNRLKVDGNRASLGTNTTFGSCIFNYASNVSIYDCEILNSNKIGIVFGNISGLSNISIDKCRIHDNGGNAGSGAYGILSTIPNSGYTRPTNIRITNCNIYSNYNTVTTASSSNGILLDADNVEISGCTLDNNYNNTGGQIANGGFSAGVVLNWRIVGNTITLSAATSLTHNTSGLELAFRGFTVSGNTITNHTQSGIVVEAQYALFAGSGNITGNFIYNNARGVWLLCAAITTGYCRGVNIVCNTIDACSIMAIWISQPTSTVNINIAFNDMPNNTAWIVGGTNLPSLNIFGNIPNTINSQIIQPALSAYGLIANSLGSLMTISSNVIAPDSQIHHLSAGLLKTITVPAGFSALTGIVGYIDLIPDAATTYDATGNIAVPAGGGTLVINKVWRVIWDGSKWRPNY